MRLILWFSDNQWMDTISSEKWQSVLSYIRQVEWPVRVLTTSMSVASVCYWWLGCRRWFPSLERLRNYQLVAFDSENGDHLHSVQDQKPNEKLELFLVRLALFSAPL